MDFLIKWSLGCYAPFELIGLMTSVTKIQRGVLFHQMPTGKRSLREYREGDETIYLIGDLVASTGEVVSFFSLWEAIKFNKVHYYGGFFYIIYKSRDGSVFIFSSVFNILPVYYYESNGIVFLASRDCLIRQAVGDIFTVDRQYLIEKVLFNYSMFDRTYWNEIKLVPSNCFMRLAQDLRFLPTFDFTGLFVQTPSKGKQVLSRIADEFIEYSAKYFPDEKFALSFTGGFDGRTLLASSLHHKKDFSAFSFGNDGSSDLCLPREQAKKLGIEFLPIALESEYINHHYYTNALDLVKYTEGYASFSRAHYLFAARMLSTRFNYMITGNFGSELFRAAHVIGVMMSRELYQIIACNTESDIANVINTSPKLMYLSTKEITRELESLISDLCSFKNQHQGWDYNATLYKFTLTEIIRKYFGPELVMQRMVINNRTPYLDFSFIKCLMTTAYCGAYSEFNTHNPVKRFKGQLAYGHIIRKTSPLLYDMKTNKGYKPKDLVRFLGKLNLIKNLAVKKIRKLGISDDDSNSVNQAYLLKYEEYAKWPINSRLYNKELIQSKLATAVQDKDRDLIFDLISTNYYLSSERVGTEWES